MATTAISNTAATPAIATPARPAVTSDYTTFLKMMTTQLQNQDPLSPMDSSDFAVQLATFSGVEQQTKTNELLTGLGGQFGVFGMAQLAGWVGQEARSAAPVMLGDSPVTISYTPDTLADQAVLISTNAQGNVVGRENVPLDGRSYEWFGAGISGDRLPQGIYKLSLESYREGEQFGSTSPVQSYAHILEAQGGASGATLILDGGIEVAATDVTALRVP